MKTAAWLPLLIISSGCVMGTQREGRIVAAEDLAKVRVGVTTKQEILDIFGPPTSFQNVRQTAGDALPQDFVNENVYIYETVEDNELFFTLFFIYTDFDRERLVDRLMVVFDAADRVKYLAFSREIDAAEP